MACLRSSWNSLEFSSRTDIPRMLVPLPKNKTWKWMEDCTYLLNQSMLSCQVLGLPWWASCFVWIFWFLHGFEWPKGHLLGYRLIYRKMGRCHENPEFFRFGRRDWFLPNNLTAPFTAPSWKKSLKITSQLLQMNLSLVLPTYKNLQVGFYTGVHPYNYNL